MISTDSGMQKDEVRIWVHLGSLNDNKTVLSRRDLNRLTTRYWLMNARVRQMELGELWAVHVKVIQVMITQMNDLKLYNHAPVVILYAYI